MRSKLLSFLTGFILLALWSSQATAVVYSDGTFSTWNYTVVVREAPLPDVQSGGTGSAAQQATGGNTGGSPDPYWQVQATKFATNISKGSTWVFSLNSAATYDPSALGAIATIDFSIDGKQNVMASGGTVSPVIYQNGSYYIATGLLVPETTWTLKQILGNTEANFLQAFNLTTPDFSASGGLITLGFAYTVSTSPGFGDSSRIADFDNWSMTITPVATTVPEPATLGLFGFGLLGVRYAARRRRKV